MDYMDPVESKLQDLRQHLDELYFICRHEFGWSEPCESIDCSRDVYNSLTNLGEDIGRLSVRVESAREEQRASGDAS